MPGHLNSKNWLSEYTQCNGQPTLLASVQWLNDKERTLEAYLCHDFGERDFYGAEMKLLYQMSARTDPPQDMPRFMTLPTFVEVISRLKLSMKFTR